VEWIITPFVIFIVFKIWQGYNEQDKKYKLELEAKEQLEKVHTAEQELIKLYLEHTKQHLPVLLRKKEQLVTKDDYGNYQVTKFQDEINYFIKSTLQADDGTSDFVNKLSSAIFDMVLNYALEKSENNQTNIIYSNDMSPFEYEHFCKDLLIQSGWDARVTQQSGDQGVDVIAESNEHKVAIQCKHYASPVGNKAVQEVYAAQQHIGALFAAVVSNNTYTVAAKELANTTGVLLLHHDDLKDFDKVILTKLKLHPWG